MIQEEQLLMKICVKFGMQKSSYSIWNNYFTLIEYYTQKKFYKNIDLPFSYKVDIIFLTLTCKERYAKLMLN